MADKKADDVKETEDEVLAVLKDDEQESPAEPSPAKAPEKEAEKPEEVKDKEEVDKPAEPESPEPEKKEEPEAEAEEEPEKSEEDKPSKAEERKQQLNTEIRDLVSKRNAIKREVEKANEAYQPATEEELKEDGMSATDAKVEALRQEIEVAKYNERVVDAQLTLSSESERVLNDFAWANPENKEAYKKELAEEAAALLDANLIRDPNTQQIIGSNVSPYQLYKTLDRATGISVAEGQLKGQQDTEAMMANADSPASAAPQKKTEDPILAILKSDEY